MRIAVTCRSAELDRNGGLKAFAKEKIGKLEQLFTRPMQAHLILDKERFKVVAELTLTVPGAPIVCVAKHEEASAAIDGAIHKAASQLRRHKEKLTEHRPPEHRRAARVRRAAKAPKDALLLEPPGPGFVTSDAFAEGTLTPELALAQMIERALPLLLFKNARTKRPNVVYQLPDGRFGLVEGPARS